MREIVGLDNLINLGVYEDVRKQLAENGKDICEIEEIEHEPSLGNGGLGRLAACFLDSIATLGLHGDGIGLNYHFGLFRQVFLDNAQTTIPDPWLDDHSWLRRTDLTYPVEFRDLTVTARLYEIHVTGCGSVTNKLRLFDIESVDESVVQDGIDFDKSEIAKNLTLFLYPDDSDEAGRLLRIYQQYFMVSAGAQLILDECTARGCNLYDLPDYAVIQINDTHPTMVIPELIRLLMERGIPMDDAISIVSRTCAYTNHTILAEALEKWKISQLNQVAPQLIPIIEVLDNKIRRKFDDPSVYIIDKEERVHMAHIDIHYGFSVNGVASLHTAILKNEELHHFYKLYPEKFNNKTNGITFRRWLMHSNPELSARITKLIGDGWKQNAEELKKLLAFRQDETVLHQLLSVKQEKKHQLAAYLARTQGISLNAESIFDIQVKRLHEYKRQQLNALYVICKYLEIHALVGDENIYIFGDDSDTVVERCKNGSYHAKQYYTENPTLKKAVDFITGEALAEIGDKVRLERLFKELTTKDWFMTFPDFERYVTARESAYMDYENRLAWAEKMLVNIAQAGYFSSDRTIAEYNRDIWKL